MTFSKSYRVSLLSSIVSNVIAGFIVYTGIKYQESLILSNDLLKDHKFKISEEIDFEDNKWIEILRIGLILKIRNIILKS